MNLSNTSSFFDNITSENEDQNYIDQSCLLPSVDLMFSVIPPYIMIIAVLGILLNIFVLMVFCLHKKSCTTAEIYLSNLAAADLLLVSFLPFYAVYVYQHFDWTFGLAMCKLVNMSILMNVYSSIYFMVLVSMDRYLALVHPLSSEGIRRPKFAKMGCVVVWILGFLFSLPALIHRDLFSPYNNKTYCYMDFPSDTIKQTSDVSISVLGFIIPIFIICFCTIKIIKTLRKGLKEGEHRNKDDHEGTTLILAFLLVFFIFCFPYHLTKITYLIRDADIFTSCNIFKMLQSYSQIFTHFSFFKSVFSPVIYIILGENLQKKVAELFSLRNHQRNITINETSTTTHLTRKIQTENDSL